MNAVFKTLVVTPNQLEDIRSALVEHRHHIEELRSLTYFTGSRTSLANQVVRIDAILLLVAKA